MRTYWNTRKRDLLKLLERDEKLMQDDKRRREQHEEQLLSWRKISKNVAVLSRLTRDAVTFPEEWDLIEMETPTGTAFVFAPKQEKGWDLSVQITVAQRNESQL